MFLVTASVRSFSEALMAMSLRTVPVTSSIFLSSPMLKFAGLSLSWEVAQNPLVRILSSLVESFWIAP
jgi:hypothetical protein